jgi:hypothetical protein
MTREELSLLMHYLNNKKPLTVKEVSLKRILEKDNNLVRIETTLNDNPDLRTTAWELLEVL